VRPTIHRDHWGLRAHDAGPDAEGGSGSAVVRRDPKSNINPPVLSLVRLSAIAIARSPGSAHSGRVLQVRINVAHVIVVARMD
jgi:hypothetical protein